MDPLQSIFISKWSKRRLTNSCQAVPAGQAGGPAQPVTLLTGQTGLFDQCARYHQGQTTRFDRYSPVKQECSTGTLVKHSCLAVLVKHRLDCYVQAVIAGSVQLILRAT
ncbi:hypothetical protein PCASD_09983 [Puccinia coronata f. sp. avenae]|uniref:Uncharacterized protein n=1 Tax=Puccinia coronata f. sp. avenae TaxID=200324 RepID=A0A2N5UUW3_9BASI|nr:hypothetical protein PCASD_09983 [Puccinia coronata f. sp. avenae]